MSGTEIEQFFDAGQSLADWWTTGMPTTRSHVYQGWSSHEIHTIRLGPMLAQVSILPQEVDRVSLVRYDGDGEMISRRLRANVHDGVLTIKGELPFMPGQSGRFGGEQLNVGITISGDDMFVGGSGSCGKRVLIVNGREVDLSRAFRIALIVPIGTNVRIGDMVGAVGIGPNLGGALDSSARFDTHVFAYDVTELTGEVSGQGRAEVQYVHGSAEVEVSGAGHVAIGSVGNRFDAKVSGAGDIRVEGGTSHSSALACQGRATFNTPVRSMVPQDFMPLAWEPLRLHE
jgi:hypothetical protein